LQADADLLGEARGEADQFLNRVAKVDAVLTTGQAGVG
jgi:hypothetical protein